MAAHAAHYDDPEAMPRPERRAPLPGRRREDKSKLWAFYLTLIIQAVAGVWFMARLAATVDELRESRLEDRAVQSQMVAAVNALRSSVDVLNCRTGITCNVARPRDIQP